ncbi:MAG: SMI1/KNR4 family protein [Luteolibacter sp.]
MKLFDIASHHGADMLPAISEDRLAGFEALNHLKLPPPLREFYLKAGGTGDFTEWSWRIWPFEELVTIESRAGSCPDLKCIVGHDSCPILGDYLAFIDVLIEAPLYAVCANPSNSRYGEVIALSGDDKPFLFGPIASMEEFELIFALHWNDILLPDKIDSESGPGE